MLLAPIFAKPNLIKNKNGIWGFHQQVLTHHHVVELIMSVVLSCFLLPARRDTVKRRREDTI